MPVKSRRLPACIRNPGRNFQKAYTRKLSPLNKNVNTIQNGLGLKLSALKMPESDWVQIPKISIVPQPSAARWVTARSFG